MWHNPRLLNLAANLLFAVAAFILLCIAVLSLLNSSRYPLRTLVVEGKPRHVDVQIVNDALAKGVAGNFFAVDLEEVRASLEEMPWIRRAHVRRQWPDRLMVELEEQTALAQWQSQPAGEADQLVNVYGELFSGRTVQRLPRFSGPLGSEAEVTRRYAEFSQTLKPLEAGITQINLSPRSSWQLKVAMKDQPALTLMLGRGEDSKAEILNQRLQRFVQHYPRMQAQLKRPVQYIDLRYPNGFAVRVPEIEKNVQS